MIIKQAFLGIFQKLMVFCCAMFFGVTHAFATGLPAGYQQVEYIQSTGTQYIDTGIVGKSGVSVEAKFMLTTEANGSLFGNRQSDNTRFWPAMWFKNSGSSVWQWDVTVNVDTLAGTVNKNTLYTTYFVSNSSGWTLDVNGERVSSGTQVGTNTNNMWMFGTNDGRTNTLQYPFIGKAYYAKIWQNATLVRDFVPVKKTVNGTDVYGMYDLADPNPATAFHTNQGTGEFTGGPMACDGNIIVAQNQYNDLYQTYYDAYFKTQNNGRIITAYDGNSILVLKVQVGKSYTVKNTLTAMNGTTTRFYYSDTLPQIGTLFPPEDAEEVNGVSWQSGVVFTPKKQYVSFLVRGDADSNKTFSQIASGIEITDAGQDVGGTYCIANIKVATRAYNTTQFAPVVTALNSAIDTIKDVVTNTINQTAAVSALQSTKQTRPDEECPAGKKCLLVEDVDGTPHWYEIIDCSADNVLAGMRFVEENVAFGPGEMWGVRTSQGSNSLMCSNDAIACQNGEWVTSYDTSLTTNIGNEIVFGIARNVSITERTRGSIVRLPNDVPTGNVCVCKATRYQLWDSGTSAYGADHNIDTDSWFVAGIETSDGNDCLNLCGDDRTNGISKETYFQYISNACNANVAVANSYLPAGYIPLEYIQSDGNSWIETNYYGTEKTGAYLKYQYHTLSSDLGGRIFGYRIAAQNQWVAYTGTYTGTTVDTTTYYIQSGAMSTSPEGMPTLDRNIHEVKINTDGSGKIYFDSGLVGNSLGATAFTASQTLRLFSAYNNSSYSNATARIYEVGIYENGVIQKHFVPAKQGTTVGMYDLTDPNPATAFHTNAGTGTFTAGPEI